MVLDDTFATNTVKNFWKRRFIFMFNSVSCIHCGADTNDALVKAMVKDEYGPDGLPLTKEYLWNICPACYFDKYCSFCQGLVLKDDCLGHEVNLNKDNRFMKDKNFVKDVRFDVE